MCWTTHELAKRLLELPDETVFIQSESKGLLHIDKAELCSCEAEVIITMKHY